MLICILALSLVFTPYLSNAVISAKSAIIFHALVALKLLVSLISRLVACSARIVVDRQTNRPTTVTLAVHACRGLITHSDSVHIVCIMHTLYLFGFSSIEKIREVKVHYIVSGDDIRIHFLNKVTPFLRERGRERRERE